MTIDQPAEVRGESVEALRVWCGDVQRGPALYWEGDYFGPNGNLAARLARSAAPQKVLLTNEVRHHVAGG